MSYTDFLATLTPEEIAASDKMMDEIFPELNDLPPIILMSRDPKDAEHVRKIKIPGEDYHERTKRHSKIRN